MDSPLKCNSVSLNEENEKNLLTDLTLIMVGLKIIYLVGYISSRTKTTIGLDTHRAVNKPCLQKLIGVQVVDEAI